MNVLYITPFSLARNHSGAQMAGLETVRSIRGLCQLHVLAPEPPAGQGSDLGALGEAAPDAVVHFYRSFAAQQTRWQRCRRVAASALAGRSYLAGTWADGMPGGLRDRVGQLTCDRRFDVVHCEWLSTAAAIGPCDVPTLVRTLDVHYVGLGEWLAAAPPMGKPRKWFWQSEVERLRRTELAMLTAASLPVTVSAEDETLLRNNGIDHVRTIPPPMPIRCRVGTERRPDNQRCALFVGRLDLAVNRSALFGFADEIWPKVDRRCRERRRVVFAGGVPNEEVLRRARQAGIEVRPSPSSAELANLFAQADVQLCPVTSGTGIKIKTLEAMAYGKAVVGYANAFRGIPAEHQRHALIAESAERFAELLELSVSDDGLRRRLGEAAQELVRDSFDPAKLGRRLVEAYATAHGGASEIGMPTAEEPTLCSTA